MNGLQCGICFGAFCRRQWMKGKIIGIGERGMIAGSWGRLIEQSRGEKLSLRPGDFHGALDVEGGFLPCGWICEREHD